MKCAVSKNKKLLYHHLMIKDVIKILLKVKLGFKNQDFEYVRVSVEVLEIITIV